MSLDMRQLYWAAGFLEAEGCFHFSKSRHLNVSAGQVQREPLGRLQKMFGGSIGRYEDKRPNRQPIYRWSLVHSRAAGLCMTCYALMSPKRQEEILAALVPWKVERTGTKFQTFCIHGHPLSGDNLYVHDGTRYCKTCRSYEETIRRGWRDAPKWENRHPGEQFNFRCKRGHDLTDEANLYWWNGKRYCRACKVIQKRAWDEKQKAGQAVSR